MTSDVIGLDDLPPLVGGHHLAALAPSLERDESLRAWARRYVQLVLDRRNGNKREAARALGISYHTLNAYLRRPMPAETPSFRGDRTELEGLREEGAPRTEKNAPDGSIVGAERMT